MSDEALLGFEIEDDDPESKEDPQKDTEAVHAEAETDGESQGKPEGETEEPAAQEAEAKEAGEAEGTEGVEEPAAEPFIFDGTEYESQEAAEHKWRSYMGSVGSKDKEIKELQGQLVTASQKMTELLEASQQSGKVDSDKDPAKEGGPSAEADKEALSSLFDTFRPDVYQDLLESEGPGAAATYLMIKTDEHLVAREDKIRAEYGKVLDERLGPLTQDYEGQKEFREVYSTFEELALRVDEKTQEYLFPELHNNEKFTKLMTDHYMSRPYLKEKGLEGAYESYVVTKDLWGRMQAEAGEETKVAPVVAKKVSEAINRASRDAENAVANAGVITGDGRPRTPIKTTRGDFESTVKAQLKAAGTEDDPDLGFALDG